MRLRGRALALLPLAALASCRRETPPPEPKAIRILLGADLRTLDPHMVFDDVHSSVLDNIFDSLVRFDRSFRLSAGLARRWINPDERTWRFFLDPEAGFPDGSPLKASDVKFSLERVRNLAGSQLSGFASHIASVTAVDDLTLDIRTDTPIAILNSLAFIPIMSEKQVREAGPRVSELPFGTGPYRLTSWEKGKSIVLEVNPHYKPALEITRAEFSIANEADALTRGLLESKPDLALFLRVSVLERFKQEKPAGLHLLSSDGLGVYYVVFNTRPEVPGRRGPNPLRDPRVRRALALATDVREILEQGLKGAGHASSQLVVPQVFGFDPRIQALPHDPDAARRLLAQAGHPRLEVPLLVEAGSRILEALLAKQWGRIGVRAPLVEVSSDAFQAALERGAFSAAQQGFACTSGDASEIVGFALQTPDPVNGAGAGNYGGYSNPEVDRIAVENLRVFDPKKRLEMLQRALRIAAEEVPNLPLFAADDIYIVSSGLRWDPPVNAVVRVAEMSFQTPPGATRR